MSEHTVRYPFCYVTYWNAGSAAKDDEFWTTCKVTPLGAYSYGEQEFPNTQDGTYARDRLLAFLNMAFEAGRSAAKQEIRDALGVTEPRR